MIAQAPHVDRALEAFYAESQRTSLAIATHLPRLRALAEGLTLAVEFGVKRGASSSALLLGAAQVISYDLQATPQARELQRLAGDRWTLRLQDSRTADVPPCDLIFFDSQHDYDQLTAELAQADRASRYLVFHDVLTFGAVAADGESGMPRWTYVVGQSVPRAHLGIRPAIDAFLIAHRAWQIAASYWDAHGLLVLERMR
jgi:hypothetical protein